MDAFHVQMTSSAIVDLQAIPNRFREQIITAIKPLSINPLLSGTGIKISRDSNRLFIGFVPEITEFFIE